MYQRNTVILLLLTISLIIQIAKAIKKEEQFESYTKIPLPDDYRTFWRINSIKDILKQKDCWIILSEKSLSYQKSEEARQFITHLNYLSRELVGVVFFGLVKDFSEKDGNSKLEFKSSVTNQIKTKTFENVDIESQVPNAYVFPYGGEKIKTLRVHLYKNIQSVIEKDLPTLPNEIDVQDYANFVYSGYKNRPVKFPTIMTIEERGFGISEVNDEGDGEKLIRFWMSHKSKEHADLFQIAMAKIISEIFKKYFFFNVAFQSDKLDIQETTELDPELQFPETFSFIGRIVDDDPAMNQPDEDGNHNMVLDTLRLDVSEYDYNFHNLVNFYFDVNHNNRRDLFGDQESMKDGSIMNMEDVRKFLRNRMPFNWSGYEDYDMNEGSVGPPENDEEIKDEL